MNLRTATLVIVLSAFHNAEARSLRTRALQNGNAASNGNVGDGLALGLVEYFEYESKARPRPPRKSLVKPTPEVLGAADEEAAHAADNVLEEELKLIEEVAELEEDEADEIDFLAEEVENVGD